MASQMTELTFLENLAPRTDLPVPEFLTEEAPGPKIREALARWKGKALVKPDLLTGKRGKAGVVREVHDVVEAQREMKRICAIEVNGYLPRTAYMVEHIPSQLEMYSALTYDSRFQGPALTLSLEGGVNIEDVSEDKKVLVPIDVFKGLDAYQASEALKRLDCPQKLVSILSRGLVSFWDMFISSGMRMCEINPWRITPDGRPYVCDFKAVFDEANFKFKGLGLTFPEYPASTTPFEDEMTALAASSHQGQAHVAELGGDAILPILFGGGASTIITETLMRSGGNPIFLSDFGGNPPYERMYKTAKICLDHHLGHASLLLLLGGKANNTLIDVTFKAIADALRNYVDEYGPVDIPVVIGRGGPGLVQGLLTLKDTLDALNMPYVMFGPDTPVTLVGEYADRLAQAYRRMLLAKTNPSGEKK